jgi:predicted O-linked N-acetylglucosamine transferase (SPINDLY family)
MFRQAVLLHQQSRPSEARALYQQILRLEPRHFQALHLSGVAALQEHQAELAADLIGKALTIDSSNPAAYVNYGTAQHEMRRHHDAIESYDKAIALKPDFAEAFHNRGNVLRDLKQPAAAVGSYDQAVALRPGYAEAHLNRGLALSDLGQHEAAIASYERAIILRPNYADAYYNRGNELRALGRHEAAVASYDKAVALRPGFADAHLNRGTALVELRRYAPAIASYDQAITLRPGYAEAHCNRAGALQHLGQYDVAVSAYDTAIALRPNYAEAHANRGRALRELKRYDAAIASYDRAISFEAEPAALGVRRHLKMQICDWHGLDADLANIAAGIEIGTGTPNPFYVLTLSDSAALARRAAELWVRKECPSNNVLSPISKRARPERLHIGYFSADFHDHATAYLIAQLLEMHDRSRFRVTAFSFGPDSHGAVRKRLKAACDGFIDVRAQSDEGVALLARNSHVDIAVDLKGFTQDHRAGIFARRAAPVQVNYLGYPGTMGATYMDYLIADRMVVPAAAQCHYAEKIIYLPHCYQVNDGQRAIAYRVFTRAELGLPSTGFVFCCFNNAYKILPAVFDCWMRLLLRVPGSVLWLLGDNPTAVRNLQREAQARQVDPRRLIFADRVDLADHLARHRAADLFIDTLPCNAHTTASDALWAGLPVLTCLGEGFAGRVAASLLTAIGTPQLITSTLDQYEELAVRLAGDAGALAEVRQTLAANRLTTPLFDTSLYARHIESAFAEIYTRYQADLAPEHVFVESA